MLSEKMTDEQIKLGGVVVTPTMNMITFRAVMHFNPNQQGVSQGLLIKRKEKV